MPPKSNGQLFERYRGKPVLLDSNLLLLFLVGTFQRSLIARFKRTSAYLDSDFDSLVIFTSQLGRVRITSHLLTEVNGLSNALPEFLRADFFRHFADLIEHFVEVFVTATEIAHEPTFLRFGLADAALENAGKDALIITDDFRLAGYLRNFNREVLNLRELT